MGLRPRALSVILPRSPAPLPLSQSDPHRLKLSVQLYRFFSHFAAETALLVASEWRGWVEHAIAVDPDRSGSDGAGKAVRLAHIAGPGAGRQAIARLVGALDQLVPAFKGAN